MPDRCCGGLHRDVMSLQHGIVKGPKWREDLEKTISTALGNKHSKQEDDNEFDDDGLLYSNPSYEERCVLF